MNKMLLLAAVAALGLGSPALANPNDPGPLPGCSPSGQTPPKCDDEPGGNGGDGGSVTIGDTIQTVTQDTTVTTDVTATGGNAVATATGGAGGSVGDISVGGSSATASGGEGGQGGAGGSVGTVSAGSDNDNSNSSNNSSTNAVTVEGDTTVWRQRRIPVSTAYAPALTSGIDTCAGSLSGGVQTGIFGISLGGTKSDKTCQLIKLGREAAQMGMPDVQCQLLALDPRFNLALRRANRSCDLPAGQPVVGVVNNPTVVTVPVPTQPTPVEPVFHPGQRG